MSISKCGETASCLFDLVQAADFICIDGFPGAGKSEAGIVLAKHIGATFVDTDVFLEDINKRQFANYMSQININDLNQKLNALQGKVIVGGCSLRAIFELLNLDREILFIYIKKINTSSQLWSDGFFFDDYNNGDRNFSALDAGEFEYMNNYQPHEIADVIFERLSSD